MKKKDIMVRLAILAVMLLGVTILAFAEIGIATAFDMRFDGLTYMQYMHEFYQVPWHFALGLLIAVVAMVVGAESIYRSIISIMKKD